MKSQVAAILQNGIQEAIEAASSHLSVETRSEILGDRRPRVIHHKSAPIRRTYCEEKAQTYFGQLVAYEEVLRGHGENIAASFIHFPFAGTVVGLER